MEAVSREMLLISLTFQVTWMLCEVTGCKVTSMGGPSGAGGGRNNITSQILEEKNPRSLLSFS